MNETLKHANNKGKRQKPPRFTPAQLLERMQTELRLERRRWKRWIAARRSAAAPSPKSRAEQTCEAPAASERAAQLRKSVQKRRSFSLSGLGQTLSKRIQRAKRRWHRIRREEEAKRFPESNRRPVQLLLFLRGMLPVLGSRIRELTWGRRKKAIHRFGHIRARIERRQRRPLLFAALAGAVICIALLVANFTLGAVVRYDGSEIAKVTSVRAVKTACKDLERVTSQALGGSYSINSNQLSCSTRILARKDVVDGSSFEETLSEEIGLVSYAYGLYVDGELVGATPYEGALEELLQQLQQGASSANTISCGFRERVEIREGYVPAEKVMNLGKLAEELYSTKTEEVTYTIKSGDTWSQIAEKYNMTSAQLLALNPGYDTSRISIGEVLTVSAAVPYLTITVTEQERYIADIPYDVQYTDSASLYKGDYKVTSAGKYGSADVLANVTYVNGEETERTVLSYVTLVNPVTEQRLRGTAERPTWYPTGTFRWPCSGSVTSRFGGRRSPGGIGSTNHKGIDIANRKGTPIYAADGGTVTYSGWMSGYGYLVIINHGNGYQTYYGHNSSLIVSVGAHVYKGQQIARMGSTGNSTGNHCHFGVMYNGVFRNPMNYL